MNVFFCNTQVFDPNLKHTFELIKQTVELPYWADATQVC